VRNTDANGFLQMPGSRTMRSPLDGKRWYYANVPSPSVPDGLGDEESIRAIWADDSDSELTSQLLNAQMQCTAMDGPWRRSVVARGGPIARCSSGALDHCLHAMAAVIRIRLRARG
jgi:hypothetical protein